MQTPAAEPTSTLQSIFDNECSLLVAHVPVKCRVKWATLLTEELDKVATQNTLIAWTKLLMMSKCILWQPKKSRGGRKGRGKGSLATIISARMHLWQDGEYDSLWEDYIRQGSERGSPKSSDLAEQRTKRAKRLSSEGLFSKACDALASNGLHTKTDEIVKQLKALHPRGRGVQPAVEETSEFFEFQEGEVQRALNSFPRKSGAGRSGLSPQHLKDAAACKSPIVQERFLGKLTRFVNLLVAGEAIPEVAPFVGGASLIASRKDDDGFRPIAIGEVLRRLASKCCSRSEVVSETCHRLLEPIQVGVGSRGGGEALVWAVNVLLHEHGQENDLAILKIDLSNAFNRIARDVFIAEVDKEIPELSSWARWCYAKKSGLWYHDETIESREGVQQGAASRRQYSIASPTYSCSLGTWTMASVLFGI